MYKLKRFICFLLILIMLTTMVPLQAIAATVENLATTGAISIVGSPGVYEMGDGYAVIWVTSTPGTGYITYSYGGTSYTVYDMKNGVIRTNDTIHVVKVPHEHLANNSYSVYSQEVTGHNGSTTSYGSTVSSSPITLNTCSSNATTLDILTLTDIHNNETWSQNIMNRFGTPDLVVFGGDIVGSIDNKDHINLMFKIMGSATGGEYPIVYMRGNHETRGARSTMLLEYLPTETGEFYYDFRYGPLYGVVMDTGEDKNDNHEYYGNLANYHQYRQKQEAWLRTLGSGSEKFDGARYRLGFYHIPRIGDLTSYASGGEKIDFRDSIDHLGLQLGISGHAHKFGFYSDFPMYDGYTDASVAGNGTLDFKTLVCGGADGSYASHGRRFAPMVTLSGSYAYITAKDENGKLFTDLRGNYFNNLRVTLSNSIGSKPQPLSEPEIGTINQFNPTTASQGTVSILNTPVVFETGGDWYNVVWKTKATAASYLGCTGYVEYEYNGQTYQVFDEVGGYRRSYSSLHTVKVPKEHLNNNQYKVGSFLVQPGYTDPDKKTGMYYTAGDYVESSTYIFEDRSSDKAVNLITCPNIRVDEINNINSVAQTVQSLGTSPAVIIMNGDSVGIDLYNDEGLGNIIQAASIVSGGIHPVVFSRGEGECRGERATDLMRYFPTATGELYYSVDIGDYTLVNLDTAEDASDSNSKYGGRVNFSTIRNDQLNWINGMDSSKKKIVISHQPLDTVRNTFSIDYETPLKNKGAVLALSGHEFNFDTYMSKGIYNITVGGYNNSNNNNNYYNCASVLVSGDYAHINSRYKNSSTVVEDVRKTVDLTTGNTVSYSAEQPPMSNGVYRLSKPEHIVWLSNNCNSTNNFSGYTFKMSNDIDMKLIPFTPIGGNDNVSSDSNTTSKYFAGTFDGNGYEIKNLYIDSANNNVGLFGVCRGATIQNVTLDGGMVEGNWYTGGLVGYANGGTNIDRCYTDVVVYSATGTKVAGLCGFMSGGSTINCCANYGFVNGNYNTNAGSVGGLVGQISGSTASTISNSYNRGTVITHTSGNAGGILGYTGGTAVNIRNCYNASAVNSYGYVGGVMGSCTGSGISGLSNAHYASGYNGVTGFANNDKHYYEHKAKAQSVMKTASFATTLNNGGETIFVYDANINEGYPSHVAQLESVEATMVYKYKGRNGEDLTFERKFLLSESEIKGCEANDNRPKYPATGNAIAVMQKSGDDVFVYNESDIAVYQRNGYTKKQVGESNRLMYYAPVVDTEVINKTINWTITDNNVKVDEAYIELTAVQYDTEYTVNVTVDGNTYTAKGKYNDLVKDCTLDPEKFIAPATDNGKEFSYWKDISDGSIVSYSRYYNYHRITGDITLEAVYGADISQEWSPTIEEVTITNQNSDEGNYVYTDYTIAYHNRDGKSVKEIREEGSTVSYGILLVRDPSYTYNGSGTVTYPNHNAVSSSLEKVVNVGKHAAFKGTDNKTYNCFFYDISSSTAVNNYNRCGFYLGYDATSAYMNYTYAAYAYVKVGDKVYVSSQPTNVNMYNK